ncbi:alanine racemase [Lacrimispora sphenoides]|jgi:alanine racemase|uniref:alanine racemase n=1 Tax=Lacrimispora sphenoides TaxID=29370 RepID=UPI0008B1684A|nr:alanine racemase [Lacrimispora sphenoides]SEU26723.1 alanine racemase [Lacrimispora sphenoides]
MKLYSRVYETVDLDAIRHNMEAMKANLKEGTRIIGVVKSDGYGHGAVPVAWAMDSYVWGYAVATVEEGVILRKHGIKKPILVLGVVPYEGYSLLVEYGISSSVFQLKRAERLSTLAEKAGKKAVIHLVVDTGMSRIGYPVTEEAAEEAVKICGLPGIEVEGLFTHFAKADERDKSATDKQIEKYQTFVTMLSDRGITIPVLHCSNSAGILDLQRANFHAVRAGISIYGIYPSGEVDRETVRLQPAMELKSFISYIKKIEPGTSVSYGGTFTADREMTIATIPVGYGDGYSRNLSGKGEVLIRGQRARILGRVCMDQFMVDVTGIKGAEEEDEVVLIGRQGSEEITVEELAAVGGGFHYEIVCDIGKRVPRVYLENGRVIGTKDYFYDCYEGFCKG